MQAQLGDAYGTCQLMTETCLEKTSSLYDHPGLSITAWSLAVTCSNQQLAVYYSSPDDGSTGAVFKLLSRPTA